MAEYLSPGVYVEEFDSGIKAMEGVGTSTAGFLGMAQKGPIEGHPVLITSMADYQRRFGGYLPERTYGEMRFLPYAVEQFFNNGGSTCYVMRVCGEEEPEPQNYSKDKDETKTGETGGETSEDTGKNGSQDTGKDKVKTAKSVIMKADNTQLEADKQFISMKASSPGEWGNGLQAKFAPVLKGKLFIEKDGTIKSGDSGIYQQGDLVYIAITKKVTTGDKEEIEKSYVCNQIKEVTGDKITLDWDNLNDNDIENIFMYLMEWNIMVWDDTASEQYESVSLNPIRSNYIMHSMSKSQLVIVEDSKDKLKNLADTVLESLLGTSGEPSFAIMFQNGCDGKIEFNVSLYKGRDGSPDKRTGLEAFKTLSDVSIMAIPGITHEDVQSALVSHCENMCNRFAILDMPLDKKEVSDLQEFRENVDSSYAAMYHPWLQGYDPLVNRNVYFPPSGSMAGIYGRTDNTRGVHKAPANEVVRNCTGLSIKYNDAEQGKLNPKGINLIRQLPGQGIRVWGARTCSSDGNWKYVNVRRLFIFIEESIKANTNWAVFEPNDEMLWSRLEGTIRVFLTTQWRNGALMGSTADEAFFINIGKSTMTEDDILNGRLICVIGVAPVRPAEFVIFRITQKMESAQ